MSVSYQSKKKTQPKVLGNKKLIKKPTEIIRNNLKFYFHFNVIFSAWFDKRSEQNLELRYIRQSQLSKKQKLKKK